MATITTLTPQTIDVATPADLTALRAELLAEIANVQPVVGEVTRAEFDALVARVAALESETVVDPPPPPPPPIGDLAMFGGGDPRFGQLQLRHRRYAEDDGTMEADYHGSPAQIATGRTSWYEAEKAVKLQFPTGLGSIYPQLRFAFDDGGAGRCEWQIQSKHVSPWLNVGPGAMSTHKSFQLAIDSQFRFTTRHQYESAPTGDNVCACNVRDIMRLAQQPYGTLDTMQPVNPYFYKMQHSKWYLYQWAIDYGPDYRKFTLSLTPEGGDTMKIYDEIDLPNWNQTTGPNLVQHINQFWVEFNSSNAADCKGPCEILVRDLQIRY